MMNVSENDVSLFMLLVLVVLVFGFIKIVIVDCLGNLANYREDYNVSLFHVVCTVAARIFVLDVMLH